MKSSILAYAMLLAVCVGWVVGGPPAAAAAGPNFLEKGRPVNFIVPYAAGGANDVGARLLAPLIETELGNPIQVVNRPGAGGQVGTTAIATAKPDGYTIGYAIFAPAITTYFDPDRKAVFSRKSFQPLGAHFMFPVVMSVSEASPYKSVRDVVEAAKAKPFSLKAATTGILGTPHLASLQLQRAAGIKFAAVQFDGGAPAGVWKEVIQAYSDAIQKATADKDHQKKLLELGYILNAFGPEEHDAFWAQYESDLQPLIEMGKAEIAK